MDKLIIKEYPFKSPNGVYLVKKYDDGSFSCNCQEWTFKRNESRNCRHTKYIQNVIAGQNNPPQGGSGVPFVETSKITIARESRNDTQRKSANQSVVRPAERYFSLEED
jgi:hypothetical protein